MSMPISYEIKRESRLVVCTGFGVVTADEVLQVHDQIVKDEDFEPSFSELVDATAITSTTVTPSSMRMLAESSPFSPDSRRALVADSPLGFGLWRVYQTVRSLRGDKNIRVFRSRTDALAWLLAEKNEKSTNGQNASAP
jgi:hypothetical protein